MKNTERRGTRVESLTASQRRSGIFNGRSRTPCDFEHAQNTRHESVYRLQHSRDVVEHRHQVRIKKCINTRTRTKYIVDFFSTKEI